MITIRSGNEYRRADSQGRITCPGWDEPSDTWRIIGAVERNNFGHVIRRYSLADVLARRVSAWKHKNGKQKVFMLDVDHGTVREWCSPGHEVL